jgi:hypothetical protein
LPRATAPSARWWEMPRRRARPRACPRAS